MMEQPARPNLVEQALLAQGPEEPSPMESARFKTLIERMPKSGAITAACLSPGDRMPASEVPGALARLTRLLRASDAPVVAVAAAACDAAGLQDSDPLRKAALDLGGRADAMGKANPYHNADHMRDVLLGSLAISAADEKRAGPLSSRDKGLLVVAALAHDLDHDGIGNTVSEAAPDGTIVKRAVPFRLETLAAGRASEALEAAGASKADTAAARGLILATDPFAGYPILRGDADAAVPQDLAALRTDPKSMRLAKILRDADLLGSSGVSLSMGDEQSARLEAELGLPPGGLGPKGTEFFLRQMVGGAFMSEGAKAVFGPVLDRSMEANAKRLADPALAGVGLAQAAEAKSDAKASKEALSR